MHRNSRRHLETTKLVTANLTAICVYLLVGKLPTCIPVQAKLKMAGTKKNKYYVQQNLIKMESRKCLGVVPLTLQFI